MFDILKYPNRRKTLTAYIVFGAISLVFVFMGMDYGTNPTGGHAAIVNDKIISPRELETAYNQLSRVYGNMFGGGNAQGQTFLRQMALNQLVNQTLINEYASDLGVVVSPAELQDFIINIPAFQEDGRFRKDYYQNFIRNQNTTSFNFEKQLRRELGFQKVQGLFRDVIIPSELELAREEQLMKNTREAKFIKWSENNFSDFGINAEKEVNAWLKKNEAAAKAEYEANPADYTTEEQVKAKHILLKTEGKTAAQKQEVLKKMQELKKQVTPENFGEIATANSEDPGSAKRGGELGFFGKGQMVPPFENAAFSAGVGQITDIVETNFGYHLILVEEKKPAGKKPFEQVRKDIAEKLMVDDRIKAFEESIAKAGDSFKKIERIAKKNKLKVENTGEVLASAEYVKGIGRSGEVLDQLFKMNEGEVSKVIESAGSKYVVYLSKASTKKDISSPQSITEMIASKYSQGLLSDWTKEVEKKADIVRNEAYLQR